MFPKKTWNFEIFVNVWVITFTWKKKKIYAWFCQYSLSIPESYKNIIFNLKLFFRFIERKILAEIRKLLNC